MGNLQELSEEIKKIQERNRRVEADKAWETSWTRRISVCILTYFVIVIFFYFARLPDPWVNSIVPSVAFLLSTSGLSFLKSFG